MVNLGHLMGRELTGIKHPSLLTLRVSIFMLAKLKTTTNFSAILLIYGGMITNIGN